MKTYVQGDFGKDALAIALGMFFGLVAAYAFELQGVQLLVGAPVGALMGYLARMLMEPERIKWAAKTAWRKVINWHPKPDWKERVEGGAAIGLSIGGGISLVLLMVSILVYSIYSIDEPLLAIKICLIYLIGGSVASVFSAILFIPAEYFNECPVADQFTRNAGWLFNMFTAPFTAVILPFVLLFNLTHWCWENRQWLAKTAREVAVRAASFIKVFVLLVHSDHFSACGSWAAIGVIVAILTVPLTIPAILVSVTIGGLVGAGMRQIVLMLLTPAN